MRNQGELCMSAPLEGLRVLDFSTLLPGPFATMMLGDLGADVIHVESPNRMDLVRLMPPYANGQATAHSYLNRNKRSVTLDLKQPESLAHIHRLLVDYDIVVEQFRPGVMARLGLDYDALKAINPRLIYCSITGYGQTGPLKDRAGHDINYLALSGVAGHSGRKESGPPPLGIQVADVAGGSLHAVIGILAAVIERQRSGQGQHIDISMTDCVATLSSMAAAASLAGGEAQRPEAGVLNGATFYDYYQTSDGRWLSIGSLEPQFTLGLANALRLPRVAQLGASMLPEDRQAVRVEIAQVIAEESLAHWQTVFAALDVCVEPVLSLEEAMQSKLSQERGWVIEVPLLPEQEQGNPDKNHSLSQNQSQAQLAHPIRFSRSQPVYRYIGRGLGADNGLLEQVSRHDSSVGASG